MEEHDDAWTGLCSFLRRDWLDGHGNPVRHGVARQKRQKLPNGAAVSLGEFQKDLHLGESLSLALVI
jgi:hypothetical protein